MLLNEAYCSFNTLDGANPFEEVIALGESRDVLVCVGLEKESEEDISE